MSYKEVLSELDVALALFALAIVIQFSYYLLVYLRVVCRKKGKDASHVNKMPEVSVIVCARNEEENLVKYLESLLKQDYPSYEVIVVNDCSEDNTEQILYEFKQKYPHLRSTIIKESGSFLNWKKFAATVGIKAAQYEWLLFTDAGCCPESSQWISSMSRYFVDKKDIVLGYGGYRARKGYLSKWIRYDTCFNALQRFGFAMLGKAYSGFGSNLAYRKSLFYAHNGLAVHAHIDSDDDGLFVNQAANKHNVAVVRANEAHIRTKSPDTLKEWLWQKSRQIVSSRYYRNSQFLGLALEPVSRMLMWASFCVLMFLSPFWEYILIVLILRMIIFMLIIGAALRKFNEQNLLKHAVYFDIIMPFVYLYIYLLTRISSLKHTKWK